MSCEWTALCKFRSGIYKLVPWCYSPKELWDYTVRARATVVHVYSRNNGFMQYTKPTIRRSFAHFLREEKPDGCYWTVQLGPFTRQFETWEEAMSFATEASNLQRL